MRKLVTFPHKALSTSCEPVEVFDEVLHGLLDDMKKVMRKERGIGIAANQLAESVRAVLVTDHETGTVFECVNPEILESSDEEVEQAEGCLSFPGVGMYVSRPKTVKVKFQDRDGKEVIVDAGGQTASCFQHEIDHINGKTFVDGMSRMKKDMVIRRIRKLKKVEKRRPSFRY